MRVSQPHPARLIATLAVVFSVLASVLIAPSPASAAVRYWFKPSDPMNDRVRPLHNSHCTGGWGIRSNGTNTPYFLTAGHCFSAGETVYGTGGPFGVVFDSDFSSGVDSARVRPLDGGIDGLQEIPGVGKTVGKVGNSYLTTAGGGIAMKAPRTGLSYGTLAGGWYEWFNGHRVACGSYASQGGDSGAPIFIHYGNKVYAAGVHVGIIGSLHCFVTIDDLLTWQHAWLPVFPAGSFAAKQLRPDPAQSADHLPVVNAGTPNPE